MKSFIIMRGIPGSGKSTYIKNYYPEAKVCSADHYFETPRGYFFDASKLSQAHGHCKRSVLDAMEQGAPLIVLDNTNIKLAWFKEYIETAKRFGYEVGAVRMICDPEEAFKRNSHGVPKDKIVSFKERLDASPRRRMGRKSQQ
jgi:predicted kinase